MLESRSASNRSHHSTHRREGVIEFVPNVRDDIGALCELRGYHTGVEVGVDQGVFAASLLESWPSCVELYLVDPYLPCDEMPGLRQADLLVAVTALTPKYHGRFRFWQMPSVEASRELPARVKPQFIYIDGAHDYDSVRMDIDCWWNRLEAGGILAGHGYHPFSPDVVQAVDEFVAHHGLKLTLTHGDTMHSWLVTKPSIE